MTPRVLILCGPTGAGKTAASLAAAKAFDAVVLSADAMQIYRGMDIGTGKIKPDEMQGVPHFGIDLRNPDEAFDVADYMALADRVMAQHPRVILAGGTHLYLRAVTRGLVRTPEVDPALRDRYESADDLWAQLNQVDPELAARLHPNDRIRLIRGLEVFHSSGQQLSALQDAHARAPDRVNATWLWLDQTDLDARIDQRVVQMFADGYVGEVQALLDQGYGPDLKPMRSLGYRHLCDHLLDGLEVEEALRRTQRDSRKYARKQRNWTRVLGLEPVFEGHLERALRAAEGVFDRKP